MKYLLLLLIFTSLKLQAQSDLTFDKKYVESEDKWVALRLKDSTSLGYGFIYIDAQAGLTLDYLGTFNVNETGKYIPNKIENSSLKIRLTPNNNRVAFIPKEHFAELNITEIPDWLKFYKTDTSSVQRLYRWGFLYNGWDQCEKALAYLIRAQKLDPEYKGLNVELAFSYNCLGQYDKAANTLTKALIEDSTDAYTNKEYIFALVKLGKLDEAKEACIIAFKRCSDPKYNGENAYNLLHEYYVRKEKSNFNSWYIIAKQWNEKNDRILRLIDLLDKDLNK
jgi:tetratricopeptide (TPR) repeat protein